MRVLHVSPFYEPAWAYGGTARAAAGLCRALARRGHEVTVATVQYDPAHPEEAQDRGVRERRFRCPAVLQRRLFPWTPGLRRFLTAQAGHFDIAHVHGHRNGLAVVAVPVLERGRVPWVLQPHGSYPHHGRLRLAKRLFDRLGGGRAVRRAAALIAVSDAEAGELPAAARVVANGVEPVGSCAAARADPGSRLLFVGSDQPQKRGFVLPQLLAALPRARLELVGRFGRRFLERFSGFGERVSVSGVLDGDRLAQAYAMADLVVHPAVGEAFGLVPFEAALLGTPAVVAGGHGCGEWFGRAGGRVVPPDDLEALVVGTRTLLGDPTLGQREATAVAAFARRELTWDRAAESVEGVYRDVLERQPRRVA